jgi:hypothetical protein
MTNQNYVPRHCSWLVRHFNTVPNRHIHWNSYTYIYSRMSEQNSLNKTFRGALLLYQVRMWLPNNTKSLLFAISALLTTTFVYAQNSSCQGLQREFGTVNSTGQHKFTWNSSYAGDYSWYVSVLVGSRGTEWNDGHDVRANAYISVPRNAPNSTGVCVYQYTNINATLESEGENSCSGVISSGCINHLTKAMSYTGNTCPDSDTGSTSEAFNEACPMLSGGSHSTFLPFTFYKPSYVLCSFLLQVKNTLSICDPGCGAFVHLAD